VPSEMVASGDLHGHSTCRGSSAHPTLRADLPWSGTALAQAHPIFTMEKGKRVVMSGSRSGLLSDAHLGVSSPAKMPSPPWQSFYTGKLQKKNKRTPRSSPTC